MTDKEHGRMEGGKPCDAVEGGYSIFLDEETVNAFMESGDFSSARELDHFKDVEAQVEKRIKEGEGLSLMALSVTDKRIWRDFAVLQISHILAKHGRSVLVVDCDFLHPGLNGLIENIEDQGFLDLLLYGSSLKSVIRPTGIDGVSVTGPGSFPVSKTVPFAQKEFNKVEHFLSERRDVVIFCSTLYAEDNKINPLCTLVDGIVLCCRIEEMEEGQLQKNLEDLGSEVPPVDLVCFFSKKEQVPAAAADIKGEGKKAEEPVEAVAGISPEHEDQRVEPAYIEKTGEMDEMHESIESRVNLPRLITIVVAVVIVAFLAWWFITNRIIKDRGSPDRMTELVQKQRDARDAGERVIADSVVSKESSGAVVTEEVPGEGVKEPEPEPSVEEVVPAGARYKIHVSSFRNIERAGKEREYLEMSGFESEIMEFDAKGERWYRVLVGEFATMEEAQEVRMKLLTLKKVGSARVIKMKDR